MEKFVIKLHFSKRHQDNNYYVEYVPNNEYDDDVMKCDIVPQSQIEDLVYLEQVTIELFGILEDKFGTVFTDKFYL